MRIEDYRPGMQITNTDQLLRGTGAKYLEVMVPHRGPLIAVQWRRKLPRSLPSNRYLIRFTGRSTKERTPIK